MAEELVACGGCGRLIQPATARRNDGLCGPCDGDRKAAQWEEHVRLNKRTVDPFAGITDPVRLIAIGHEGRQYDPLIEYAPIPEPLESLYGRLTPAQAEELVALAVGADEAGNHVYAGELALHIAAMTEARLDALLWRWLEERRIQEPMAFRGAGPAIRDRLLGLLTEPGFALGLGLEAAAWIGDDVVVGKMMEMENSPVDWKKQTGGWTPARYARVAGWECVGGRRRELAGESCFAVRQAVEGDKSTRAAGGLSLFSSAGGTCPWCVGELFNVIDVPAGSVMGNERDLNVATCPWCAMFVGVVYAERGEGGRMVWSPANEAPAGDFPAPAAAMTPWAGLAVTVTPRGRRVAAHPFLRTHHTQVGGLPAWLQNPEFPECVQCRKTMSFFGQVDQAESMEKFHEGVYYAFRCVECDVMACTYQQT